MTWTPLQLQILLHYYSHADDFRDGDFAAPAVREAIDWFRGEAGFLEIKPPSRGLASYRITERGRVLVRHLLSAPMPVQVWTMPNPKDAA